VVVVLDGFGTGHYGELYGISEADDYQLEKMPLLRYDSSTAARVAQ